MAIIHEKRRHISSGARRFGHVASHVCSHSVNVKCSAPLADIPGRRFAMRNNLDSDVPNYLAWWRG